MPKSTPIFFMPPSPPESAMNTAQKRNPAAQTV
jgi:hypothetical protein